MILRVVLLQDFMGLIKDEPDSGSEACVTTMGGGNEDGNINVEESNWEVEEADIKIEEALDIKEENPEAITFPPIKTEPEVSEWSSCVRQQQFVFPRPFTATKRERPKIHFDYLYVRTVHFVWFII
jgi:hypothetical protein